MKVGDYVRTKDFGINRVKWFDHEEPILENGFTALQRSGYKSSPNIIDLIEVGDYVNGSEVCKIYDNNHLDNPIKEVFCMGKDGFEGELTYTNDDIKSIVTKEQFEAMQYKVGE